MGPGGQRVGEEVLGDEFEMNDSSLKNMTVRFIAL